MLPNDYEEDILAKALPSLTKPRKDLLDCPTWFVVEHPTTGEIVGCGGWTRQTPGPGITAASSSPSTPHLRHFATDPAWARCGVGRALWDRIWDEVRSEMGPTTSIEVFSTLTAESFYGSLGFEPVKYMTIPMAEDCHFPCVLMRRTPEKK